MADVRSGTIVPVLSDFSSFDGTPLYVNRTTARGYILDATDTIRPLSAGSTVNVVDDYGADPTGTTDSTLAIQAAFDDAVAAVSAEILFPVGTYNHTDLTLMPATGQIHVNLRGLGGAIGVQLNYTGTDGIALTIKNNTRFTLDNLYLLNGGSGTNWGLWITSLAFGSNTGPGSFRNVVINAFDKNYVMGGGSGESVSEIVYQNLEVLNATTAGVELHGANSLNHQFYGLNMSGNATGLEAIDSDCVFILSGSASGQTVQDFAFRPAGAFGIKNYRSESAERFLTVGPDSPAGSGSPSNITIENCRIGNTAASDLRAIRFNKAVQAAVRNNHIQEGHLYLNAGATVSGSLEITGNLVADTVLYEIDPAGVGTSTHEIVAWGNRSDTAATVNYWDDERFLWDGATKIPLSTLDLTTPSAPLMKHTVTVVTTANLPAASAAMDGTVFIEDAGGGVIKAVIYGNGLRSRLTGVMF